MGEKGPAFALFVAVLMVVTGSLNTLSAKWADRIEADGHHFNHPFLQAGCMFTGEVLCMLAYLIHFGYKKYKWSRTKDYEEPKLPSFNMFVFLPPAICDIIATSVMYIGLTLTTASSYQMLRGALIVCTGLLSIVLVKARIQGYKWIGMLFVVVGLAIVGITDIFCGDHTDTKKSDVIIGDVLCVIAQVFVALQLVLEQKYLHKHDVEPLLAVGLEGIYGIVLLIICLVPLYFIHVGPTFSINPDGRLEDVFYAWKQIKISPLIAVALGGLIISIAFFNFAGLSVTKELSATTRTIIDSIRTIVIWAASIPLFHAQFIPYQIIGFVLLLFGMCFYNDILFGPWIRRNFLPSADEGEIGCGGRCCFSFWGIDREQKKEDAWCEQNDVEKATPCSSDPGTTSKEDSETESRL